MLNAFTYSSPFRMPAPLGPCARATLTLTLTLKLTLTLTLTLTLFSKTLFCSLGGSVDSVSASCACQCTDTLTRTDAHDTLTTHDVLDATQGYLSTTFCRRHATLKYHFPS